MYSFQLRENFWKETSIYTVGCTNWFSNVQLNSISISQKSITH